MMYLDGRTLRMLENDSLKAKIKTVEELKKLIGSRPRQKSVIMCHGAFDIVHPGHVRHLIYAKGKADLLVASLTCDNHISKANFRPYVPEQIRALNLAALEVVDYVIVDSNPTPIENIRAIQPDFFAKGYEYFQDGVHPKTAEEVEVLESYGGEVIFTPGDVIYSSSRLIESQLPDLSVEKLDVLMKEENVSFEDLRKALDSFSGTKVHVTGDTIVDTYTYCSMVGNGTKTPTPSVKYIDHHDYVGGAAVVAKHLKEAGAQVTFSTVLGNDELMQFVLKDLDEAGVVAEALIDKTRPTTQKNAFITDHYRMLKVDRVDNRAISDRQVEKLRESILASDADGFVFSDFRHGIFSPKTIPRLSSALPMNKFRVADSQVASRWGNVLDFKGFDLITPNEREARFSLGDQDSVIRPLALNLYRQAESKFLILKVGERGILTYRQGKDEGDESDPRAFFTVDSFVRKLVDAVGAGDALLSYATLSMIRTGSEVVASILGSMAAAVACEHEGNNPVSPKKVHEKLNEVERYLKYSS